MKGTKPQDMDAYIAGFPEEIRVILEQIRARIKEIVPEAEEKISYGMPTFTLHKNYLIYFAAFKNHIGLYALPTGHEAFKEEFAIYKSGKGSVQFPFDKPIPYDLIDKVVKFRVQEVLKKINQK